MSRNSKAVVIGSGVAGLASAIRLAVLEFDVTVFEKNSYPGGKLSHFMLNNFSFDAGPSLFTQPENIAELFELAGEPISQYFQFERVPVTCTYFFESGTVIHAFSDPERFALEMQVKTGENAENILAYLNQSSDIYNRIGKIFLDHSLHKKSLFKAPIFDAVKATKLKYLFSSLHQLNASHFEKKETIQLFNRFATYNGSNPYKAPAMLSLISHLELNEGTYYPKGGMKSITDALYALALKKGVRFHFNSPVQKIAYHNDQVNGVLVNDIQYVADVVVSNMDVFYTYKNLLNISGDAKRLLKQERSSSAVIFYWGIGATFPELNLHNIFFSSNYEAEFDALFTSKTISDDSTVYINITSKMEKEHAPAGNENWFVMVNAPYNENQDWELLKHQCRQAVIKKLNRMLKTDLQKLIVVEETLDPIKIEQKTGSFKGALYGTSSNSKMAAFLRHPNFSKKISGLYFAGGTVHPGGGIPLCFKSAKLVAGIIEDDRKKLK